MCIIFFAFAVLSIIMSIPLIFYIYSTFLSLYVSPFFLSPSLSPFLSLTPLSSLVSPSLRIYYKRTHPSQKLYFCAFVYILNLLLQCFYPALPQPFHTKSKCCSLHKYKIVVSCLHCPLSFQHEHLFLISPSTPSTLSYKSKKIYFISFLRLPSPLPSLSQVHDI